MLDRYVSGSASRLSPEAPIPVLRPTASRVTLGGAANVALNIATLGGHVSLVGVVGEDDPGREVAQLLAATTGIEAHLDRGRRDARPRRRRASWLACTSCCAWTRRRPRQSTSGDGRAGDAALRDRPANG